MPKLSRNIRAIAAAVAGPKMVHQIEGVPGLNLAALGNGKASWRLRYRPKRGAGKRWHTIGDAQTVTLGDAMDKARELMSALQIGGLDPKAALDGPSGLTFDALFHDWLERRAKAHKKSWAEDVKMYHRHVESRMGNRIALEVTRRDVIATLTDIAAKASGIQANRAQSLISVVFGWAVRQELVEINPARDVQKLGLEKARERVLSHIEIAAVWSALQEIIAGKREGMTPRLARLIATLMLTGARKGEVMNMPVAELVGDVWSIPASRMKGKRPHTIPLAPLAMSMIRDAIADNGGNSLVFPGRNGGPMEPMSVGHALGRLLSTLAIENVRPHDLRRTMASEMGRLGIAEETISRVLAHAKAGVTQRHYNLHSYDPEKRAALRAWETELARIVSGAPAESSTS